MTVTTEGIMVLRDTPAASAQRAADMAIAIDIKGVTRMFGPVAGLGGIDLSIAAGEFFHAARLVRLRQEHAFEAHRRL